MGFKITDEYRAEVDRKAEQARLRAALNPGTPGGAKTGPQGGGIHGHAVSATSRANLSAGPANRFPISRWLLQKTNDTEATAFRWDGEWHRVPASYPKDPVPIWRYTYSHIAHPQYHRTHNPTPRDNEGGRFIFRSEQKTGAYTGRILWYVEARYITEDEADDLFTPTYEPPAEDTPT